jgi:hypothetical protein
MKTLVNHNGVIQYKHIIKNLDELQDYFEKVYKSINLSRFQKFLQHPDDTNIIKQMSDVLGVPPLEAISHMNNELFKTCYKNLNEGKVLVFNEAGGYCFLDDRVKILDWKFLHECKDIVVLERSEYVDSDVIKYIKENNIGDCLVLNNLSNYTNEELLYYCGNAKTIIFKTSGLNVNDYIKLAENIESKNIFIINSPEVRGIPKFHNVEYIYSEDY